MRLRRPPADYLAFARGLCALAAAQLGVALNRVPACASALGVHLVERTTPRAAPPLSHADVQRAARVARRLASALGERNYCVRHALIVGHLLRAHSPVLRFGVRREDNEIEGHAWVEVGGVAVGRDIVAAPKAFVVLGRAS